MTRIFLLLFATVYSHHDPGESERTACGGFVRDHTLHAAVRDATCGDQYRVCSTRTNRCVVVVADDAGPWGLELDLAMPPWGRDWRSVKWNSVHRVWTPTITLMNSCRVARNCQAPAGWRFKNDIDLSPRAFRALGHQIREGRIAITLERRPP